jgi:hypothetical protein
MESIHIKAKDHSNIFVEGDKGDDGKQEICLSVHRIGGHCSTRLSRESAKDLIKALEAILASEAD